MSAPAPRPASVFLKAYGDEAALSRCDRSYGEAKAQFDAVIAGLIMAMTMHYDTQTLPVREKVSGTI